MAANDIPNIVVMVGGTVDPGNLDPLARANSYQTSQQNGQKDPNWYWADNQKLLTALKQLAKKYKNLHLLTAHGWSGDNAIENRRIAGAYLANRLCGGKGEKPYYEAFLKKEVAFHLIGHSHGGNVINELTREAATSKHWPKQWKIRSITYLSTPFFRQLHPVHTGAFDKDCRVLNVFCKYDLTQRVIADFSLQPMTSLLKTAGVDALTSQLDGLLKGLGFDRKHFEALLKSVYVEDLDDRWLHMDLTLMIGPDKGIWLYTAGLELLRRLHQVFKQLKAMVNQLNKGIDYPVPKELDPKKVKHRVVMSPALAQKFLRELNLLEAGLLQTETAFKARLKSGKFPLMRVIDDLHVLDFLDPLLKFLEVDRNSLSGPLWDLIAQLLQEQVEKFDNTSTTPAGLLQGTPFASRIVPLDITRYDAYNTKGKDRSFDKFIRRLEDIEARYAQVPSKRTLLDLLFSLFAAVEPVRALAASWATAADWCEGVLQGLVWIKDLKGTSTRFDHILLRIAQLLESYGLIIQARDCGQLEVPGGTQSPAAGSLGYLSVVAHSTSRQDLYPEVLQALQAQLNTQTRSAH